MKRMTKLSLMVLGMIALVGGDLNMAPQPSQAATHKSAKKVKWHKGTPKAIRGKYQTKHFDADLMSQYKIGRGVGAKGRDVVFRSLTNVHISERFFVSTIINKRKKPLW